MKHFDSFERSGTRVVSGSRGALLAYRSSTCDGRALMKVCRSWKAFVQPRLLLYASIRPTPGRPNGQLGDLRFEASLSRLKAPVQHIPIGQYVRRLAYTISDSTFALSAKGHLSTIDKIGGLCPSLESIELFVDMTDTEYGNWDEGDFLRFIESLPSHTLTELTISWKGVDNGVTYFLSHFLPTLTRLDRLCRFEFEDRMSLTPLGIILRSRPLCLSLESLTLGLDPQSFPSLSWLSLPRLRSLQLDTSLKYRDEGLVDFISRHGTELRSLSLAKQANRTRSHYVRPVVLKELLSFCPNLEDLCLSIPKDWTANRDAALGHPLRRVRRLALKTTWQKHDVETMRSVADDLLLTDLPQVSSAMDFVGNFCLPLLPSLETVRWVGSEPQYIDDAFIPVLRRLNALFLERGIRFENCLGDLFGTDSIPRNRSVLSVPSGQDEKRWSLLPVQFGGISDDRG